MKTAHNISAINRSWLIKVYQKDVINKLVGVAGLIDLIGEDRASKFIDRAFNSFEEKVPCKVYGTGMLITFYAH